MTDAQQRRTAVRAAAGEITREILTSTAELVGLVLIGYGTWLVGIELFLVTVGAILVAVGFLSSK
jgi:hypothetical protein